MHDFYYTRLLDDPAKFEPRSGNRCVEVFDQTEGQPPRLVEYGIAESKIKHWIEDDEDFFLADQKVYQPSSRGCRLRLLIGSPEQHHNDAKILPLPISRDTFEAVRTAWNMPTELLRMMLSTLPIATQFQTTDAAGRSITGVMVRSARSRDYNFCLGLAYNEETGLIRGILNGMQNKEIELLLTCLRKSAEHLRNPALVPIFLIELKVHYFAVHLEKRAEGIEKIEYETGMRHGFSSNPRRSAVRAREREQLFKDLDFDEITQKLTGVTGTLSFCDMTFTSSLRALDLVCGLRERNLALQGQCQGTIDFGSRVDLNTRLDYVRELIVGAQAHGAVLSARTRAQVQTVYSMIGQKDNKLNIATAAASREIAEISLRHNTAMKDMAEDSRNVAILTRKDSTDMRIIAVVTLMFLPGTFMATLFSSGFFNFLPSHSNQVVSKWIWLYFVLTGVTTLVVFLAWFQFSKKQNREMLTVIKVEKDSPQVGNEKGQPDQEMFAGLSMPSPGASRLWTERSRSIGQSVDVDPCTISEVQPVEFKMER